MINEKRIGWIQVAIIIMSFIITVATAAVVVTRYIDGIERRQTILEVRTEALDKYGSTMARNAKSTADIVAAKQSGDMQLINEKLQNLLTLTNENRIALKELRVNLTQKGVLTRPN